MFSLSIKPIKKWNSSLKIFQFQFWISKANLYYPKCYASSLFISGNKANESFAYLSPYLDFEHRFNDVQKIDNDLFARGVKINAWELKNSWNHYKYIISQKDYLENKRVKISTQINKLMENEKRLPETEQEIKALKAQA